MDILQDQVISYPSEESVANQNKKIEKILILDTETTGLDENKDEVIEIGCILFDVSFKCVLSQVSFLFPVNNNEAGAEGGGLWNGSGSMWLDGVMIDGNVASGNDPDQGGGEPRELHRNRFAHCSGDSPQG